jgi:hypothetical protein
VLQWMFFEQSSHEPYVVRSSYREKVVPSFGGADLCAQGEMKVQNLLGAAWVLGPFRVAS